MLLFFLCPSQRRLALAQFLRARSLCKRELCVFLPCPSVISPVHLVLGSCDLELVCVQFLTSLCFAAADKYQHPFTFGCKDNSSYLMGGAQLVHEVSSLSRSPPRTAVALEVPCADDRQDAASLGGEPDQGSPGSASSSGRALRSAADVAAVRTVLNSAIDSIRTHPRLPPFWLLAFATKSYLSFFLAVVLDGLADGAFTLLTGTAGQPFPSLEKLISLLNPVTEMRAWGVYIKLGIPTKKDLPLLIHIGSATGSPIYAEWPPVPRESCDGNSIC